MCVRIRTRNYINSHHRSAVAVAVAVVVAALAGETEL